MPNDKHTPGPWYTGNGIRHTDTIGICRASRGVDGDEDTEETIAEVLPAANGTDKADARLISSAPDLLDAIRPLFNVASDVDLGPAVRALLREDERSGWDVAIAAARAAIAKATGEA